MCTHITWHAWPCNCILSRKTQPCVDANISIPPTFPAAGPGYRGSSCPVFKEKKERSDAKCKRHSAAENYKMGGTQAPERIRSSSEPVGGTKYKKHASGEKLKMAGIQTPQRKGSGSESVGGIGGVIEAGLDFEFGLVGLHGGGSPPTKVERMASVAKRVKPGKVKEMVMKFNAVIEEEESAKKVSEETPRKTSGESVRKVGGKDVLEDQGAKIGVAGARDQAEAVKIDEEKLEGTVGDIVLTYHHDDMSWKEGELLKHGEDMEEIVDIYDYYDTYMGTEAAGDDKQKAWKVEETEIEIAQKFDQGGVAVGIKETDGQGSMIEKLDETTGHIEMATKAWWANENLGQDPITTKAEEAARQNEIITDITRALYPEDKISKIDDTVIQSLTDSGVDENFDGDDNSTYLDSVLDEEHLARDLSDLTVDVPSTRMSTLVREYSVLVSPVSELDDALDLHLEPSTWPPTRQNSDLISPVTEFGTDSASSSRSVTPADPAGDWHLELSPSTTPLLQRARTGSQANSHHSIASAVSACSGFSSNYSDYSASHGLDTTHSTSLTTNSTSDPFYIPPSTTNTPSFTTSSTPFTPQTLSGSFDSFVDVGDFASYTPPVSFEDFITSLPGHFDFPRDLEREGEGGVVAQEDVADGLQSLMGVPVDDTIWNWDGRRWVGQREDGSLVLVTDLF